MRKGLAGFILVVGGLWFPASSPFAQVLATQKISYLEGGFQPETSFQRDRFGSGIASLGDLDGDGIADLAVGATHHDFGQITFDNSGSVFILFLNADGTVREHVWHFCPLPSSALGDDAVGNFYGTSLTALGDLDGDGVTELAVGAPGVDEGSSDSFSGDRGAVWILFLRSDGTVKSQTRISSTMGGLGGELDDGDQFGASVAALGDLDGDGLPDLAVGAPGDDDSGSDDGALWILGLNSDGSVRQERKLATGIGLYGGPNGYLGRAMQSLGDFDRDGTNDLVLGLWSSRKVVLLLLNPDGTAKGWSEFQRLSAAPRFGWSVSGIGDWDGDGVLDIAVGDPEHAAGGIQRGMVWVFLMTPLGAVREEFLLTPEVIGIAGDLDDHDWFGSALAWQPAGGGRRPALVVGATGDDDEWLGAGAAWRLDLCPSLAAAAYVRNGGSNPLSYFTAPPRLGGEYAGFVDLQTTGHSHAYLFGFDAPARVTLAGGQVLLCADASGSGPLLDSGLLRGPIANWSISIPNDPALCGARLSTQALHVLGRQPFALSNARDLVVGP